MGISLQSYSELSTTLPKVFRQKPRRYLPKCNPKLPEAREKLTHLSPTPTNAITV